MAHEFLNAYHFVPTIEGPAKKGVLPATALTAHFGFVKETWRDGHAVYVPDRKDDRTFSGRIVCKLTTKTPMVVGGQTTPGKKNESFSIVEQYERDGAPAVPATSIKGLVSSTCEAVSGSALRVLSAQPVKIRKPWREGPDYSDTSPVPTIHDFFEASAEGGADLLPMNHSRLRITPAERLFGYVPIRQAEGEEAPIRPVAGRIRFSDARPYGAVIAREAMVSLRELASPKPPSPSLYFRTRGGDKRVAKSKETLVPAKALPQGRKLYLHVCPTQLESVPWKTQIERSEDGSNRKAKVEPVATQSVFWFHADFDNLSTEELALLYAGLKPSPKFWHKLGMGKSLGLGSVEIEPVEFQLVDRYARYADEDALNNLRWQCRVLADYERPECYRAESASTAVDFPLAAVVGDDNPWVGRPPRFPQAVAALLAIGETHAEGHKHPAPVLSSPMTADQWNGKGKPKESKGYSWFVDNEKFYKSRAFLKPLGTERDTIIERELERVTLWTAYRDERYRVKAGESSPHRAQQPARFVGETAPAIQGDQKAAGLISGQVKWFSQEKGFGFISADDGGKDVFVHVSILGRSGIENLAEGQAVVMRIDVKPNGDRKAVSLSLA